MSFWLAGALLAAVVAVHLAKPRFRRHRLSAARFFSELPPARKAEPRLSLTNPTRSRPLYFHLPLVALLIAAVGLRDCQLAASQAKGLNVWILVDTSGSMLVEHPQGSRMALARAEAEAVLDHLENEADDTPFFARLSSFDLERLELAEGSTAQSLRGALAQVKARPLGTDLELVRAAQRMAANPELKNPYTHLVVISDTPAPEWVDQAKRPVVIWRHVGPPANNLGFAGVEGLVDPLTGTVRKLRLSVASYGTAPEQARVRVRAPDGQLVLDKTYRPSEDPLWRTDIPPSGGGRYQLELEPGGAWALDDRIAIQVPDDQALPVDWRLPDRSWLARLRWVHDPAKARFRVMALPGDEAQTPTLLVGDGFRNAGTRMEIGDFVEGSDLIADLDLDAFERLNLAGFRLPEAFEPALRNQSGEVLLAQRREPLAVFVPGLPVAGEANLANISTTCFFNGVRHLLGAAPPPPLYQLTQPGFTELTETRLAIHPEEGNTARTPRMHGSLGSLTAISLINEENPLWPRLLALAALLFVCERVLAVWGGGSWR